MPLISVAIVFFFFNIYQKEMLFQKFVSFLVSALTLAQLLFVKLKNTKPVYQFKKLTTLWSYPMGESHWNALADTTGMSGRIRMEWIGG